MSTSAAAPIGETLDLFREHLPRKPYYTDDFGTGLHIASREKAAKARYIQPNGPTQLRWLLYDVDRPGAALDWHDLNAPPPTIAVMNPRNGHAHLLYLLEEPVCKSPAGRSGPLRYAAAVDCALREKLDADRGYSGLICKNPLCPEAWGVTVWEGTPYGLGDLDSWVDLNAYQDKRKRLPDYGLGRNCNLFDKTRHWAYRAIRQGWPDDLERWFEAVHARAKGYNAQFEDPLPANEVKHTAWSIARYVHRNFSPEGFAEYVAKTHTPEIQAERGRKKGAKKREELMPRVRELAEEGMSQRQISKATGVPQKTVSRWLSQK